MVEPGLRPRQRYTVPYMWWTTGVGYDPKKIKEDADELEGPLGRALEAAHLDARRLAGGVRAHAHPAGPLGEHDEHRGDGRRPSRSSSSRSRWSAPTDRHHRDDDIGRCVDRPHLGRRPFAIQETIQDFAYYIPEEGGVKGSDTMAIFTGSPHPIAAQLFINHLLDAHNSAANTNLIYYMGPNAAAKEFIDPAILYDPTINPDQEIVDKLEELLRLDQSVRDEYLSRWQQLAGLITAMEAAIQPARRPRPRLRSPTPRTARAPAGRGARPARGRLADPVLRRAAGDDLRHQPRRPRRPRPDQPGEPVARQLRAGLRPGLPPDVPELDPVRLDHDDPVARDRLSDRLLDQPIRRASQGAADHPRDAPVLDELPDPDLLVDHPAARQRGRELDAPGGGADERADHPA